MPLQYGRPLSRRQHEAIVALTEGCTKAETAARMGVTEKSVETHRRMAYLKLGARNGPHAVALAIRTGVL